MSFWSAVVAIVAIIAFVNLRIARDRIRAGWQPHRGDGLPSAREHELQREVEDLRERVKVLERIATDKHDTKALAAEIDSLRDQL